MEQRMGPGRDAVTKAALSRTRTEGSDHQVGGARKRESLAQSTKNKRKANQDDISGADTNPYT